jgi:hypothetical protein
MMENFTENADIRLAGKYIVNILEPKCSFAIYKILE